MTDTVRNVLGDAGGYLDRGWSPIPLPAGKKWPPPNGVTGWRGHYTTAADLHNPDWDWSGNIAIRLPPGVVGIDVDAYHGGSVEPLEERWGKLPPTVWSTSRDDGSGIALFRVPVGTVLATDPAEGIDIVQAHHRYMVCAPSVHPDTGLPYRFVDELAEEECDLPEPGELPQLPWPWIEGLAVDKHAGANAATPEAAGTFVDGHAGTTKRGALKGIQTRLAFVRPGGRHDALVACACWAMREAAAGLYPAAEAIDVLHRWWIGAVADNPRRREGGEFGAAILWAIGQAENDSERVAQIRERPSHVDANGEVAAPTRTFDDAFWSSRWYLDHIRQAARSRLVAPPAVLGAVLARVAAFTPPSTCLPALIGSRAPLSLYVALRGRSGAGKSSPESTAADLLPGPPPGCVGPLALGSGEGLVEAFMELVEEEYETEAGAKKRKVKRQVHHGALFSLDEGQALAEISSRKGSTILPVLRTAWSGGDPGQANASIETRRHLRAGSYAVGLVSLWQDHAAAQLIADQAGGTPQRFVWLPTDDPEADVDTPEWPGALEWTRPPLITMACPLELDQAIIDEVRVNRVLQLRGELDVEPLDAHRRLSKLKIAGVLAVLDGRRDIDVDDWHLAETVMSVSDAVRTHVIGEARRSIEGAVEASHRRAADREVVIAGTLRNKALSGAAKSVARRVRAMNGVAANRREISRAIAGKYRQLVTVDEVIDEAERLLWIQRCEGSFDDGKWLAGEAAPA